MAGYLVYVVILVISIIISLILLKLVIMKLTDFYDYVNIGILIFLILAISIFLFPKHIDTYFEKSRPNKSCDCFGLTMADLNNFEIEKDCYGIKLSCQTFEEFKEKTLNDYMLCERKNDFYDNSNNCYYEIAKLMAGRVAGENGSFDESFSFCDRISNNLKDSCIRYVTALKNGGVVFSPPEL